MFSFRRLQAQTVTLLFLLLSVLISSLSLSVNASPKQHILILGDSLSAGYGIEIEQSWPTLLQQKLDQEGIDAQVHNASISGQTSAEGLAQVEQLLKETQPDLLILELGANDGLRGLSLSEMKQNLAGMIQQAQAQDAKVLLLGMHIPSNYGRRYTKMFHNTFIKLSEEYQTGLVPFMLAPVATEQWEVKPGMIQSDGLHPTAKAQPLILDHLWAGIEERLR